MKESRLREIIREEARTVYAQELNQEAREARYASRSDSSAAETRASAVAMFNDVLARMAPGTVIRRSTPGGTAGFTAVRSWIAATNAWWGHGYTKPMTPEQLYDAFAKGYIFMVPETTARRRWFSQ